MIAHTRLVTAAELERMPQRDERIELVQGRLIRKPLHGWLHGQIVAAIAGEIGTFVRKHQLGKGYLGTGFTLSRDPDNVRAPDAAFVSAARAARQTRREGFFDGAPDLAVEVISPTDTVEEIEQKVLEYLDAGTKLVWVANPRAQTITAYRALDQVRVLTRQDTLDGADVLPGFAVAVTELFE